MRIQRYLVVGYKRYKKGTARLAVQKPTLESNEVAIVLNIELPDALFTKPSLSASVKVPDDAVTAPVIDAVTTDNIQEVVQRELGINLEISVPTINQGEGDAKNQD